MKMTLDEFFNRDGSAAKELKKNLANNLSVMLDGTNVDAETREALMRVNLIMIRQCLQDYGDES